MDATRDELRRLPAHLRQLQQEDREDRTERPAFVPASNLVLNPMSVWVRLSRHARKFTYANMTFLLAIYLYARFVA